METAQVAIPLAFRVAAAHRVVAPALMATVPVGVPANCGTSVTVTVEDVSLP